MLSFRNALRCSLFFLLHRLTSGLQTWNGGPERRTGKERHSSCGFRLAGEGKLLEGKKGDRENGELGQFKED
jgi:hypothetical protein